MKLAKVSCTNFRKMKTLLRKNIWVHKFEVFLFNEDIVAKK